jgi:hypothetical protein
MLLVVVGLLSAIATMHFDLIESCPVSLKSHKLATRLGVLLHRKTDNLQLIAEGAS